MEDYFKEFIDGMKRLAEEMGCKSVYEMTTRDGFKVEITVRKMTEEELSKEEQDVEENAD